ncbi:MAG: hypothetical protein Q7U57_17970 [Methylovulum sp.]|nr:hypothetical protein [Methylovulum sp.]
MNRSYALKPQTSPISAKELSRKTAVHEAGHAAAIYLGNKQKQLPPVFFQIDIKQLHNANHLPKATRRWVAKVEGGRLIHTLPGSVEEATQHFSASQKQAYLQAFEADIVNLLVGPLAEANYVALRDDEIINSSLVTPNTLHYYGGASDLKIAQEYIACLVGTKAEQEQKLSELFLAAFHFINDRPVWRAVTALANHLLLHNQNLIEYEEIIAVLDAHLFSHRSASNRLRMQPAH